MDYEKNNLKDILHRLFGKEIIEYNKKYNLLMREAKKLSKIDKCILCGKKITSACYSHVVPKFILKNIECEGKVSYGKTLIDDDIMDFTKGVNNSFVFRLICKECDKKVFNMYESEEVLIKFDNFENCQKQEILGSISIKTHLSHIYSKLLEHNEVRLLYPEEMKRINGNTTRQNDIIEHRNYINEILNYNYLVEQPFEILFNTLLDYKTLIACQTIMCLMYDLKNKKVFDNNDGRVENAAEYLYLAIFPLKDKTRIIFYIEKKKIGHNKRFIKDFVKLKDEEKIHLLFFMLIIYSEQFYMNPLLKNKIVADKKICKLYRETIFNPLEEKYYMDLRKYSKYNNYLSKEYSYIGIKEQLDRKVSE